MSARPRGYAQRVDVSSDAATVWRALTTPEVLRQWCAPEADILAREGGVLRAAPDLDLALEAHIDVFQPPRRLRLIYLPTANLPPADNTVVDDFMLDDSSGSVTVVRLLGSGFPATEAWDVLYRRMRTGWEQALPRLKALVEHAAGSNE